MAIGVGAFVGVFGFSWRENFEAESWLPSRVSPRLLQSTFRE